MLTIIFTFRLGFGLLLLSLLLYLIFKYFDSNIRFLSIFIFVAGLGALLFGILHPVSKEHYSISIFEICTYGFFGLFLVYSLMTIVNYKLGEYKYYNHGQYFWWGILSLILYLIFG